MSVLKTHRPLWKGRQNGWIRGFYVFTKVWFEYIKHFPFVERRLWAYRSGANERRWTSLVIIVHGFKGDFNHSSTWKMQTFQIYGEGQRHFFYCNCWTKRDIFMNLLLMSIVESFGNTMVICNNSKEMMQFKIQGEQSKIKSSQNSSDLQKTGF